jgi:AcrR family transcriptional regulator
MRRRNIDKQLLIRRKALQMLVREGLDGFSMQKLARASRVSPATLYIYFEHRDDLVFQIYKEEMGKMVAETLAGFDPDSPFAEGLRVQWKNRARYCLEHPLEAEFLEQVRHSPYQGQFFPKLDPTFFDKMVVFVTNAIRRKELLPVSKEIYWSIAYAPLYQLLKFHQSKFGLGGRPCGPGEKKFELDDASLDLALKLVVKALKP